MNWMTRSLLLVPAIAWALSLSVCAQDLWSPRGTSSIFQPPSPGPAEDSPGTFPAGTFASRHSWGPYSSDAYSSDPYSSDPYSSDPYSLADPSPESSPSDVSQPVRPWGDHHPSDERVGTSEFRINPSCPSEYHRWWVRAEGLYWDRVGDGGEHVLAIDLNNGVPGDDTVLNANDLGFAMEPGWRVLLGFRPVPYDVLGGCPALEFSYFGGSGWEDSATAVGDGNLAIPGVLGLVSNNFFMADEIRAVYRSQLNNVEANLIQSYRGNDGVQMDFVSGLRFLALNEDFSLIGTDVHGGTSSYDIAADNYLYGVQLGGRVQRQTQHWSLQVTGKAGVLLNTANQSQVVTDDPNAFVLRKTPRVRGTSLAMLGEVDVTLVRRITNTWSARIGYSVLGVNGLALAPDQLDFTDTFASGTALSTRGFVLFHGGHAGLEAAW